MHPFVHFISYYSVLLIVFWVWFFVGFLVVFCTGAIVSAADSGENPKAVLKKKIPDVKRNGLIHFSIKW